MNFTSKQGNKEYEKSSKTRGLKYHRYYHSSKKIRAISINAKFLSFHP